MRPTRSISYAGGDIDEFILEAKGAIKDARSMIAKAKADLDSVNLADTVHKANLLLENTTKKTQAAVTETQITLENLRRTPRPLTVFSTGLMPILPRLSSVRADPGKTKKMTGEIMKKHHFSLFLKIHVIALCTLFCAGCLPGAKPPYLIEQNTLEYISPVMVTSRSLTTLSRLIASPWPMLLIIHHGI